MAPPEVFMNSLALVSLVVLGVLSFAMPSASSARDVVAVTCGVQGGANGVQDYHLAADLDCTGTPSSIQLAKGDRLLLNGYTLTGVAILAFGNVRVFGPGTITGVDGDGVRHTKGQLTVREVTVTANAGHGVDSMSGKVKLERATITGNGIDGVAAFRSVHAMESTVTGNGRFGISTRPDALVAGGAPCSETKKASFKLNFTTVTGNGTDPDCGATLACADVAVCERVPQLRSSVCGTSHRLESGIPGETLGVGVCVDE
jgi:hypothetical protein